MSARTHANSSLDNKNYPYENVGESNIKVYTEINALNNIPFRVVKSRGRCLRTPEDFPIRGMNISVSIETIEDGNNELYSVEKPNNNLEDRKELEQLYDKEYGNGAVIKLSYVNSEYLKKLIGEEYYGRINGLSNQIDPNSLFSVWSDIYGREKNELCSIEEDLWYLCSKVAEKYKVSKRIKLQEWLKIYKKLLIDLMKKEFSDLHDLLVFMENDSCTRSGTMRFVAGFMLERIELWYGMVWFGMAWFGMAWFGMAWFGMLWFSLFGMVLVYHRMGKKAQEGGYYSSVGKSPFGDGHGGKKRIRRYIVYLFMRGLYRYNLLGNLQAQHTWMVKQWHKTNSRIFFTYKRDYA
ncbi:phist protein [Plasmodium ovale wallikeri]|uniref:Phist protein n=1 Tax=Plasmodium ovale wallikeri TaxID=864142 RepID=A0A1A9AIZ0_PLAOA|nr:phist protein [Plasmodium ovale wallikeri]SBT56146.1 phist protein [Plasmodium ovale wallikeri]